MVARLAVQMAYMLIAVTVSCTCGLTLCGAVTCGAGNATVPYSIAIWIAALANGKSVTTCRLLLLHSYMYTSKERNEYVTAWCMCVIIQR